MELIRSYIPKASKRRGPSALFLLLFICALFVSVQAHAARNRYSYEEDNGIMQRELRDTLSDLRHEVNNHEAEIRMFEEKMNSQEAIIDSLRKQIQDNTQASKEFLKGNVSQQEEKLSLMESNLRVVSADTKQLKSILSENSQTLADSKQRITALEKIIELQNENIANLHSGLRSLMDVMGKESSNRTISSADEASSTHYRVKAGDTLEKIAKKYNTTIKKLKELNNLSSDQIIVGQKLQIAEPAAPN